MKLHLWTNAAAIFCIQPNIFSRVFSRLDCWAEEIGAVAFIFKKTTSYELLKKEYRFYSPEKSILITCYSGSKIEKTVDHELVLFY